MSQNPIIKKGYKQTEIGVIPEDWEVAGISDLFQFQGGSQPAKDFFSFNSKEGYIRLLQIRDYKGDKYETYIPARLARRHCDIDDIMIGRYGPPIFQILKGLTGAYNVALIKAIPSKKIIRSYGWYIMKQDKLFSFIEKLSQRSSGQTGVDLDELRKYKQPLPTTEEQSAIASILSDTDALIGNLDKLIEKKKAIKQGMMQELLTGKRRLAGFSEEWKERKLGDICEIKKGQIITETTRIDGNIPVIAGGKKPAYYHIKANRKGKTITISGSGASAGFVAYHTYPIFASDCSTIEESSNYSVEYIYHCLQLQQLEIYKRQTGGAQPHIHPSDLKPIIIELPTIENQEAIANILTKMDNEIDLLGKKKNKYQSMKQGMMQQLLTGNIRVYGHN